MKQNFSKKLISILMALTLIISGANVPMDKAYALSVPKFSGSAYCQVNNNKPKFNADAKKNTKAFEKYAELDSLGRCGTAYANICEEIMPTEKRGNISSVHPTGWHTGMGWQRCHLIGYQLSGENANERNLITGTQFMNVSGMLPFENLVAKYVKRTDNHVLYRVKPIFKKKNLIANGVEMEAWSVEDHGDGICFNVFCYNVSKSATINYKTGVMKSKKAKVVNKSKKSKKKAKGSKIVYWTPSGSVYHLDKNCRTLARSNKIFKGTITESGKSRACKVCS